MRYFKRLLKTAPIAVIFAVFILVFTLLDMSFTNRARSEMENRPLATRPKLSWSVLMDGSYDEKFDTYINDQFVGRDWWITLKSFAEIALLKTENNGVLYGKDEYLFGKLDMLDRERYPQNTRYLSEFFTKYPQQQMTLLLAPNSYEILTHKLPFGFRGVDETGEIAGIYGSLPKNVRALSLTERYRDAALSGAELYYRTDHHWTTEGAYLAVEKYAKTVGKTLPPLSEIPVLRRESDFLGTYYSKAKKAGQRTDTLTLYDTPVVSVTIDDSEKQGLYDLEKLSTRDKYAAYLWGNNNVTKIVSRESDDPSRLLVIKDSYGNSLVPFLTYLYDEITVLDLRYLQGVESFLEAGQFEDLLLCYNFETFTQDGNLAKLRY